MGGVDEQPRVFVEAFAGAAEDSLERRIHIQYLLLAGIRQPENLIDVLGELAKPLFAFLQLGRLVRQLVGPPPQLDGLCIDALFQFFVQLLECLFRPFPLRNVAEQAAVADQVGRGLQIQNSILFCTRFVALHGSAKLKFEIPDPNQDVRVRPVTEPEFTVP